MSILRKNTTEIETIVITAAARNTINGIIRMDEHGFGLLHSDGS